MDNADISVIVQFSSASTDWKTWWHEHNLGVCHVKVD